VDWQAASQTSTVASLVLRWWSSTWQAPDLSGDQRVRIYLNRQLEIEITGSADFPDRYDHTFLGGRADNDSNWEGRLDEVAQFDRALSEEEAASLLVK
jgi:hypothetical protein